MDGRWLVLGGLFLGRMCMGLQLAAIAAIEGPLRGELGFSYTQIGVLVGLFLLPGVVVAFPGTLLGRRFGERRLAAPAVLLMALGSAVGVFAQDFETAAAGRLIAGAGGILVNVLFTRLIADLFVGRRLNLALAVLMSSWPLGLALATVLFPVAATELGWRETLALLTLVTALSALLLAAVLPLTRPSQTAPPPPAPRRRLSLGLTGHEFRLSLLAGFAWAAFTAGGIIFLSFAPPFFMERGHSLAGANALTSFIVWGGLLTIPLGGWLADRYGIAQDVVMAGTLGTALCLLLVPLGGPALLLTVLMGLAWGLPPGPYMGILQAAVSPTARAGAYGVYFTLFYGGIGVMPAVAGLLRDRSGTSEAPLYFAALVMALSVPALIAFRRGSRRPLPQAGG